MNRALLTLPAFLALAACGGGITAKADLYGVDTEAFTPEQSLLWDAAVECDLQTNVADDGSALILDTSGEEDEIGDSFAEVECVLDTLDVPASIVAKIEHTRALDGTLSDTFDVYEITWNYHPDNGLNLIIEAVTP